MDQRQVGPPRWGAEDVTGDGPPITEHCAQTDEELSAFQQFYREHRGTLIWYLRRAIPEHDYVLVADEALGRVWLSWNRPAGNRLAWALAIARNLACDVRRAAREVARDPAETDVPLWRAGVDAELHFELRETLQQAAENLSPNEFLAVLLPILGFAPAEVAARIGARPDSIRRYRSDARKKLNDWRNRGCPPPHAGQANHPGRGGTPR